MQGARLEQVYALNLLLPGLHTINTWFSCGDILNSGIMATRDLPELNRLEAFIVDEFRLLRQAVETASRRQSGHSGWAPGTTKRLRIEPMQGL